MTQVNDTCLPTCEELGEMLKSYGNKPVFSGCGWMGIVGFKNTDQGVQIIVKRCPPQNVDPHKPRE